MRIPKPHFMPFVLLLGTLLLVSVPQLTRAQCSAPYLVDQTFPTTGVGETRWRICFQPTSSNGLVITAAFFKKSPTSPFVRVFWDARISEIFVPYHQPFEMDRFYDLAYTSPIQLSLNDCPPGKGGTLLAPGNQVCKELRDRGLAWKDDTSVRRGEEVVLWGALDAANYNYIIEWTFRDDGMILGRAAATAQNISMMPFTAHMHGPVWRMDIDLNGFTGDSVYLGTHVESGLLANDHMSLIAAESGHDWNPLEYTSLHIQDATLKNAKNKASAYHLMPVRQGTARHQEPFTKKDFWVTRYNPAEMFGASLPTYVSTPAPVSNSDVVVWYYGGAHHLVRDEDGEIVNVGGTQVWKGEAHLMWTGFMLKPHNFFDKTPLYP